MFERFNSFLFFMHQYPYLFLFSFTLISRTFIAISSSHWLMIWIALELNIISFIPILTHSSWLQETEAGIKYLLFQAIGSAFILLSAVNPALSVLTTLGLLVKLGAAPFHFWFPSVINRISWAAAILLLTWQKIAPIRILITSSTEFGSSSLPLLGALGALIGGLGGLTQSRLRPMLAYSSIGHMGWIVSVVNFSPLAAFVYFISYLFISIPIVWVALQSNIYINKKRNLPLDTNLLFFIFPVILSLRGLPPLLGFMPKLLSLIVIPSTLIAIILILGSLINLRYYLNFFFSLFLSSPASKQRRKKAPSVIISSLVWLARSPFPFVFILLLIL